MKKARKYALKLAAVLTVAMMCFTEVGAAVAFAEESEMDPDYEPAPIIEYEDFDYQVNEDNTITITEYTGSEVELTIPAEIDGYQVSAIGPESFTYLELKSLTVPAEIKEIGSRAFEYSTITEDLTLPKGIVIQNNAFSYTKLPEVITIPEGAVLKDSSFSYFSITKLMIIESGVVVEEDVFSYNRALEIVICGPDVTLENEAFESSRSLAEVILCGDVILSGDPFYACDNVVVRQLDENDLESITAECRSQVAELAGLTKYTDGKMTFYMPQGMISMYNSDFDLTLVNIKDTFMMGIVEYPDPSILDFENDDDIQTMVNLAGEYVEVDGVYKVKICGWPSVWINIHDIEDQTSIGTYLYISTDTNMYYLMYISVENSFQEFIDMVETIVINGVKDGTDISAIPR